MSDTDATPAGSEPTDEGSRHTAGAFDIRTVIGGLLGVYGVILVLTGLLSDNTPGKPDPDDYNANLITGLVLVVVAGIFLAWARIRPIVVPAEPDGGPDGD